MEAPKQSRGMLQLDQIVFIGRTYEEYVRIFALDVQSLREKSVLDCPAGSCSFTARAQIQNIKATAVDVLYNVPPQQLFAKGAEDIDKTMRAMPSVKENYIWDFYGDVNGLRSCRQEALRDFAGDFEQGVSSGRYVHAILPDLPFPDHHFDLVLSGYFLFTYSDRLSFAFHMECLMELVRVSSGEVRVYPLVGLDASPHPRFNEMLDILKSKGIRTELRETAYRFVRGADHILRLFR